MSGNAPFEAHTCSFMRGREALMVATLKCCTSTGGKLSYDEAAMCDVEFYSQLLVLVDPWQVEDLEI